jgi:GeoRSP system radical SAM/SPASM protein
MSQPEGYLATPLSVTWSLSLRCNFRCRHCYSRGDASPELAPAQWRRIVDRLVAAGVLFASFGGGEPLLVEGLTDLVRYAAGRGLSVSLNTNGWLLDAAAAQALGEAGVTSVGVSLDGATAEVHDSFRDHPGSHVRALAALDHLRQAGVRATVSTVIHRGDRRSLPELLALVRTHGAAQLFLHNFKCFGQGLANRADLDLIPVEWREFYQEALAMQAASPDFPVSFDDPVIASLGVAAAHPLVKGSTCGKLSLNIRPNGDLTPCGFLPVVLGNILTDDLETLWHSSPVLAALRNKRPTGKCQGCASYGECLGGCTARAFALSGRFDAPDPHCWVG